MADSTRSSCPRRDVYIAEMVKANYAAPNGVTVHRVCRGCGRILSTETDCIWKRDEDKITLFVANVWVADFKLCVRNASVPYPHSAIRVPNRVCFACAAPKPVLRTVCTRCRRPSAAVFCDRCSLAASVLPTLSNQTSGICNTCKLVKTDCVCACGGYDPIADWFN